MSTDLKTPDARTAATRAFVRSLNILLKFARLYGFDHARTGEQFQTAWRDLQAALPADTQAGLLLGAAGSKLLLDGVPLEDAPAERSFAQLLSGAGVSSIYFSQRVTQDDLARLGRAFPSGGAKPVSPVEQLKEVLDGVSGIRINEIRFVAEDASLAEAKTAAKLTASALGADAEKVKAWLDDPQKLLQLIAAAETSRGDPDGSPPGEPAATGRSSEPQEEEILGIMRLLSHVGRANSQPGAAPETSLLREQLSQLPERAQASLRQALAALAAAAPETPPDEPALLKLAENLAIQYALDRYGRGEVHVNAVREMLDRMGREIDSLRKTLGSHEEKMLRSGTLVESHAEILDRQFWAGVPESGKRSVLLSPEAWCIPLRNARQYLEELLGRGEQQLVHQILLQYASCINSEEAEGRRRTALGLSGLAELYGSGDGQALVAAIRQVGAQLSLEREAELQNVESDAFIRLAQEAAARRCYAAVQQAVDSLDSVENHRPAFAHSLRPRVGVENRLAEFIEEAVRAERVPEGLAEVMRLMPRPAMDHLAARFNRSGHRRHCARLVELARELGPDGVSYLREQLRVGPAAEAAETVGVLCQLDPAAIEQWLFGRLRDWQRPAHDRVVRLLASSGAPERGRLLLGMLDALDPLIVSLALDEIGMSGDTSLGPDLVSLVESYASAASAYLRLKAIEALGRLRVHEAIPLLRRVAETKQVWRWLHPSELRVAAVQALERIDPEWARDFVPRSGLSEADLGAPLAPLDAEADSRWLRQRRYKRIRLAHLLAAVTTNLRDTCRLEVKVLSLSGGLASFDRHLPPGTLAALKLGTGLRPIRAQAIVRDARAHGLSFEFVEMDLEDRAKLRRLLAEELGSSSITPSPAA